MQFYSPSEAAFFNSIDFGAREIVVVDEELQTTSLHEVAAREERLQEQRDARALAPDETMLADLAAIDTELGALSAARAELVRNPPMITVPNSGCRLPEDAFAISAEQHAEMLEAINSGKIIAIGAGNTVTFTDLSISAEQVIKTARRARDNALAASDWTMVADAPLSPAQKAAWRKYRKGLRDIMGTVEKELRQDTPPSAMAELVDAYIAHGPSL